MRKFMFLAFVALALCGCGDSSDNIEVTKETRNPPEIFWDSGVFRMRASTHFITEYFPLLKVIVKINAAGDLIFVLEEEVTMQLILIRIISIMKKQSIFQNYMATLITLGKYQVGYTQ